MSRRDNTRLTVGFNLRMQSDQLLTKSRRDGTLFLLCVVPAGLLRAYPAFAGRRLKPTVNKILSLRDFPFIVVKFNTVLYFTCRNDGTKYCMKSISSGDDETKCFLELISSCEDKRNYFYEAISPCEDEKKYFLELISPHEDEGKYFRMVISPCEDERKYFLEPISPFGDGVKYFRRVISPCEDEIKYFIDLISSREDKIKYFLELSSMVLPTSELCKRGCVKSQFIFRGI